MDRVTLESQRRKAQDTINRLPPSGKDSVVVDKMCSDLSQQLLVCALTEIQIPSQTAPDTDWKNHSRTRRNIRPERPRKRSLSREQVIPLRIWALNHVMNMYPTSEEKKDLEVLSGLDQRQVNDWFSNLRKRVIKPLQIEFTQPESPSDKA